MQIKQHKQNKQFWPKYKVTDITDMSNILFLLSNTANSL